LEFEMKSLELINGNNELEIEITDFKTELYQYDRLQGWSGSAKINGQLFTGEFAMSETYEFDGVEYNIDWSLVLGEMK